MEVMRATAELWISGFFLLGRWWARCFLLETWYLVVTSWGGLIGGLVFSTRLVFSQGLLVRSSVGANRLISSRGLVISSAAGFPCLFISVWVGVGV